MDTSKLKKFAIKARKSLMGIVAAKLDLVLEANSFERRNNPQAIKALEGLIAEIGKEQTIEKVAYTWFNRFIALRFMDVNHYTKIGVVSPAEGQTQPEVLSEAKAGYVDKQVVSADAEQRISGLLNGAISSPKPQEEVYKLLLVAYCNAYNKLMPFMFERIKDYTELLMPDDLLSNSSVLIQSVETLDTETCKDVEVIGWLYQYFITEINEYVYSPQMAKKRISKDLLPATTQIFTPEWAVEYMVENSVGKIWLENHPNKDLQIKFKYYLEAADKEAKTQEITNPSLKPQEIKVLDPACGSGHILVKAFEVLFEIYKTQGWSENEIPEMILTHNLYGLEICDRAAQLAQFAVMMKARQYDRNIFNKVKELNICSIRDTNWLDFSIAEELLVGAANKDKATKQIKLLQETFKDAKEYGSILKVNGLDFDFWNERINYFKNNKTISFYGQIINGRLRYIIKQAKIMQQQYECVVTNPPYLGSARMSEKLLKYVTDNYKEEKSDLCSVFYKQALTKYSSKQGYIAFITTCSWMFLKTFEELRKYVVDNFEFSSLVDYGTELFDGKVGHLPIVSWVNKNAIPKNKMIAIRLIDYCYSRRDEKKIEFFNSQNRYYCSQSNFSSIPGSPIAYWASDRIINIFKTRNKLKEVGCVTNGLFTCNNDKFVRLWYEVYMSDIDLNCLNLNETRSKWYPYNKGGESRKYYGNSYTIVNFKNNGYDIRTYRKEHGQSYSTPGEKYYLQQSISWSFISGNNFVARYYPNGFIFDIAGSSVFLDEKVFSYILGFMFSKLSTLFLQYVNPTMNFQAGNIASLPIIFDDSKKPQIDALVEQNIAISKDDWDSFETSWDFEQHPLIRFSNRNKGLVNYENISKVEPITEGDKISECFAKWKAYKEQQFNQLKANEEELNRLFIEIYGLQDEMTPEVADKDITVAKADEEREIKSLISYAVGCMFGRYSLDAKGLIYAGGDFDAENYQTFEADDDGVIPVLSEHYFADDIVERFNKFIKVAFGERYYAENMAYIASVLSTKANKSPEQVLREYFIKDFYKDHVQMYQKRPIYWMFSSEKNAFNALIYLHRYNKDTVNLVLNEYLREYKNKLQGNIDALNALANNGGSTTMNKIVLQTALNEADDYERNILFPLATERKEIDLDDGVKVNYLKFGKALRNIGLKEKA